MRMARIGDVYLNRRSGHLWRVLRVSPEIDGYYKPYRMITLRNERSGTVKYETSLYLLNPEIHTRMETP